MNIKNPASDLAQALVGQTLAGVTLADGENLFYRDIYPMPMGLVVVFRNSGGAAPRPYLSSTASAYFTPSVQCLVYSMPGSDGFDSGEALARALVGFLHQGSELRDAYGYVACFARDSSPSHLGPDPETQRERFSLNFELQYVA